MRTRRDGITAGSLAPACAALLLALAASLAAAAAEPPAALPGVVTRLLAKFKVPADSLSLYIKEHSAAGPLIAHEVDTPRIPASVLKVLTTYAALELLGPDYTWETHFHLDGKLSNDGTLNGNLVIQGGGDPFLVQESFWHMLHTLRLKGLKHIKGDLLIDDGLFEIEPGSPGDFDEHPYHVYNALPDATLINFRANEFHLTPRGGGVSIYADPVASNLEIRNKLHAVSGPCTGRHKPVRMFVQQTDSGAVVEFKGDYLPACGEQTFIRSVLPNYQYVFGVFKALWESMDGTITGSYGPAIDYDDGQPFYVVKSRPLSEIITYINKFSNNVMTRQLLLTLGREINGGQGTKQSGAAAISEWLTRIGVPTEGLVVDNGSGLSRTTRITARTLGLLLEHAYEGPYQPEFFSSLPLAGVDGTMRKRLRGRVVPGDIRMKTGIIDNVRSMAGYVKTKNKNEYFVVSLQNYPGIQSTTGTIIQDALLKWLYEKK